MIDTLHISITELKDESYSIRARLADVGWEYIKEVAKQMFEKYPELENLSWVQYNWSGDHDSTVYKGYVDQDSINGCRYEDGYWERLSEDELDDGAGPGEIFSFSSLVNRWVRGRPAKQVQGVYHPTYTWEPVSIEEVPWQKLAYREFDNYFQVLKEKNYTEPDQILFDMVDGQDPVQIIITRDLDIIRDEDYEPY